LLLLLFSPISPAHVDWSQHYPSSSLVVTSSLDHQRCQQQQVRIADIGCGFGGLLVSLAPLFPETLILGLEIRERVVQIDQARIDKLRFEAIQCQSQHKHSTTSQDEDDNSSGSGDNSDMNIISHSSCNSNIVGNIGLSASCHDHDHHHDYNNISVVRTNIMKSAVNYFMKGQLDKMFILFPDPHFKRANHRRRVINHNFLALYAYILREGGLLYTITDVHELHLWMVQHLNEHPLFERVTEDELQNDVCYPIIMNGTEEGQKVSRLSGNKYPAVYRRKHRDRGENRHGQRHTNIDTLI